MSLHYQPPTFQVADILTLPIIMSSLDGLKKDLEDFKTETKQQFLQMERERSSTQICISGHGVPERTPNEPLMTKVKDLFKTVLGITVTPSKIASCKTAPIIVT